MNRIIRTDNKSLDFKSLIIELDAYLKITDGEDHQFYNQFNSLEKIKNVVVAYKNEKAIGCGAFREFDSNTVEIKRMYVKEGYRGKGIANTILTFLEHWAKEKGYKKSILETGNRQVEAISFYKKSGYRSIPNYGHYTQMNDSNCFKKLLK
tara:strand:+ start:190 stop:642 length:453 start_codon:yes stop_codon:yes gene_type:complete